MYSTSERAQRTALFSEFSQIYYFSFHHSYYCATIANYVHFQVISRNSRMNKHFIFGNAKNKDASQLDFVPIEGGCSFAPRCEGFFSLKVSFGLTFTARETSRSSDDERLVIPYHDPPTPPLLPLPHSSHTRSNCHNLHFLPRFPFLSPVRAIRVFGAEFGRGF